MSEDLQTRPPAADPPAEPGARRGDPAEVTSEVAVHELGRRVHSWWPTAVLWVFAAVCWTVNPMVGFVLLTAGVVVRWRRKIPTYVAVLAVPTAYVIGWCALGQVLALADVTFLASRIGWALGWVLVTAAVLAAGGRPLSWLAERRSGAVPAQITRVRGATRWTWLPAGLFALVAGVQSCSFDLVGRWITIGTDPMQLVLLIQQMAREGALITTRNLGGTGNLAGQAYPKGLQWVITATLGPAVDPSALSSAQTLELYIRVFGGFVWLTIAAMFCVAAGMFLAGARRWHQPPAVPVTAALLLMLAALGVQQFGAIVVFQGALSSGAAVACVWALFWAPLADVRLRVLIALLGCAVFITANTWQPVVIVVAVIGVFLLWPYRRGAVRMLRTTRVEGWRSISGVLLLGWLAVVLTLVPITGLLLAGGVQHATATGGISPPSLPVLGLQIVVLLVVAVRFRLFRRLGRSGLARVTAGAILGLEVVWLAMTAATRGDAGAYYPLKVLWFATVSGWPLLALALAIAVAWGGARIGHRLAPAGRLLHGGRLVQASIAGVGVVLLAAVTLWPLTFAPQMASAAVGRLDTPPLIRIVSLPDPPAGYHYVPYLLNRTWEAAWKQSYVAAKFLAFRFDAPYLVWTTDEPTCAILRSQRPVVLVTIMPWDSVAEALKRDDCALPTWQMLQLR